VSPLVVLGSLGTLISTVTILPHVAQTLQTKKAGGSPLAWAMGVTGSTVWLAYGIASGDFLVGAPGLITIPCGLFLVASSRRAARAASRPGVRPAISIVPEPRAELPYPLPARPADAVVHAMTDTGTIRAVRIIEDVPDLEPVHGLDEAALASAIA